jgi:RNA polymerase sigma-B factor
MVPSKHRLSTVTRARVSRGAARVRQALVRTRAKTSPHAGHLSRHEVDVDPLVSGGGMSIQQLSTHPRASSDRADPARAEAGAAVEEMSLAIWRVDDTDVVRVDGVLDLAAAVRLRLTLYGRLDAGASTVVVDLTGVRLMDASAVNVLLTVRERLAERGGSLTTPGAGGLVLQVLEIAGVAERLRAYDTLAPRLTDRSADTGAQIGTAATGTHGGWGDEVNVVMGRLGTLPTDDVTARRTLRDEVIRLCLPFAERLARRFHGLGEPVADLDQVAALGLVKAIDRYDPGFGTDFPSFATPTILGELKRHFRDRGWSVRVPRRLQELRLDINRARDQLTHDLGRVPTMADLAAHLDVDEDAVVEAVVAADAYRSTSIFAPVGAEEGGPTLADRLGAEDHGYEAVDIRETLQPLLAGLSERERQLITMRFFGNMTQVNIAERLGISQMHVSRLLTRTLSRLREEMLTTG